jgi:hypothetical protein
MNDDEHVGDEPATGIRGLQKQARMGLELRDIDHAWLLPEFAIVPHAQFQLFEGVFIHLTYVHKKHFIPERSHVSTGTDMPVDRECAPLGQRAGFYFT